VRPPPQGPPHVNHESFDSFLLLPIEIVVHNLYYENSVL